MDAIGKRQTDVKSASQESTVEKGVELNAYLVKLDNKRIGKWKGHKEREAMDFAGEVSDAVEVVPACGMYEGSKQKSRRSVACNDILLQM